MPNLSAEVALALCMPLQDMYYSTNKPSSHSGIEGNAPEKDISEHKG